MSEAIFERTTDGGCERFVPTARAAGPWAEGTLHGGPPSGLLARAIEHSIDDADLQIARLGVDLFRPVPMAPLEVTTRVVREGRRIRVIDATLRAGDTEVSRATSLVLRRGEAPVSAPELPPLAGPEGLETTSLMGDAEVPVRYRVPPGFHTTIGVRHVRARGQPSGAAWIHIPVPLVEGEETSPFVRLAATADFGNALSQRRDPSGAAPVGFINADLTLYLHRPPEGEWIGIEAQGVVWPSGLGIVEATLHDASGAVGRLGQALLAQTRFGAR